MRIAVKLKRVAVLPELYVLHPLWVRLHSLCHQREDAVEIVIFEKFICLQKVPEKRIVPKRVFHRSGEVIEKENVVKSYLHLLHVQNTLTRQNRFPGARKAVFFDRVMPSWSTMTKS